MSLDAVSLDELKTKADFRSRLSRSWLLDSVVKRRSSLSCEVNFNRVESYEAIPSRTKKDKAPRKSFAPPIDVFRELIDANLLDIPSYLELKNELHRILVRELHPSEHHKYFVGNMTINEMQRIDRKIRLKGKKTRRGASPILHLNFKF